MFSYHVLCLSGTTAVCLFSGNMSLMRYISYQPSRGSVQRTRVVWSMINGHQWSSPCARTSPYAIALLHCCAVALGSSVCGVRNVKMHALLFPVFTARYNQAFECFVSVGPCCTLFCRLWYDQVLECLCCSLFRLYYNKVIHTMLEIINSQKGSWKINYTIYSAIIQR